MERAWALESDRGRFTWQGLRGILLPGGCVTLASSPTSLNLVFYPHLPKGGDATGFSVRWREHWNETPRYSGVGCVEGRGKAVSFTGWAPGADA